MKIQAENSPRGWRTSIVLFWALGPALLAGTPRVGSVYPAGGQRGTEIQIECSGSNLEDATGALFDSPGFEVSPGISEKTKFQLKVRIAPEVTLGEHSFRVLTKSGIGDVRLFFVSPFPMREEVEPGEVKPAVPAPPAAAAAMSAPLEVKTVSQPATPIALSAAAPLPSNRVTSGITLYGRTFEEDQDSFEIEAKKGERISAEVIGVRLQNLPIYDPWLSISKKDGSGLVQVDDTVFSRQDPVVSFLAPEDGVYVITIKEATNSGQGLCRYLLNIGSFARPLAVYPAGGPAGEDLKVQFLGDAGGTFEQTIKLPDKPQERFEVFCTQGEPTPQPNLLRVSNFPNVLEIEPNNVQEQATAGTKIPAVAFNGIIESPEDTDYFKLSAQKGGVLEVKVYARRLRSPLDSVLTIFDAKGKQVAVNDDDGQLDSGLRWTVAADGDYFLRVEDKLHRGGPLFFYRVEVTPVQPKITLWTPEMTPNLNQERRTISVGRGNRSASLIRLKRSDVAGDVNLAVTDLPPGITANAGLVDKSVDTVAMVFEATPDAVPAVTQVHLAANLPEPAKAESEIQQSTDLVENGNQLGLYSIRENHLVVGVTESIPVKLSLVEPKVPLLQSGSLNLKILAERSGDFKGPLNLALLYAPPGIGTGGALQIPEGKTEAVLTMSAEAAAALKKWKICVVGSADFGHGLVWFSTQLVDLEVAPPLMTGQIARSFVDQGDTTTVTVKLQNKVPFEGKAKLILQGLPANTSANEVEISKDDLEAKFTVKAQANAPVASHKQLFCQIQLAREGEMMSHAFGHGGVLRIDKAAGKPEVKK